jgi:antitoxin FitA-like protein
MWRDDEHKWYHYGTIRLMANLSIKDIPDRVHSQLKKTAKAQGRSLNSYIIHVLELDAAESTRRARMRAGREGFRRFVKTLPYLGDSTELIREDRENAH